MFKIKIINLQVPMYLPTKVPIDKMSLREQLKKRSGGQKLSKQTKVLRETKSSWRTKVVMANKSSYGKQKFI